MLRNRYRIGYKGSFTVEAALIFSMVVFVVLFTVYSAFYLHNVTIIQETAYETAIYGTMLDQSDTNQMKQKMQKKYTDAIEGRLISMEDPQVNIEVNGGSITVSISGSMRTVPVGFLSNYNNYEINAKKKVSYSNPLDKIRILKLIEELS